MKMIPDNDIQRFLIPQRETHRGVLQELEDGCKVSHWMWFTFPQVTFPNTSYTSEYYSIKSTDEAEKYIYNSELRSNLEELCEVLLRLPKTLTAHDIFGFPDDRKLQSCMTLFDQMVPKAIYERVLNRFYNGERCQHTIEFLKKH